MNLHDEALKFIEEYRQNHPDIYFWLRHRYNETNKEQRHWFQGTDDYVSVGLYKMNSPHNKTKTIGIVFWKVEDVLEASFEVVYTGVQDQNEINFYQALMNQVLKQFTFEQSGNKPKYNILFNINGNHQKIYSFLDEYLPKIDELLSNYNLSDQKITKEDYENSYQKVLQVKQELDQYEKILPEKNKQMINDKTDTPLNQILYGPPGTGKTYNTINKALEIIDPDFDLEQDRDIIKQEFDKYVKSGRIVFTTFHQSMAYEDFIEGIKPSLNKVEDDETTDSNEKVYFNIEDGIFKKICMEAKQRKSFKQNFDELWKGFYNDLTGNDQVIFKSITSEMRLEKEATNPDSIAIRFLQSYDPEAEEGKKVFKVSKYVISKIYNEKIVASEEAVDARKQIKNIVGAGRATTSYAVYKKFYEYAETMGAFESEPAYKPFVLIIDEINRGNVSEIFGELITLIEKDKREGCKEALSVFLPYSKEPFSVPPNLYIIGTMNTADRSVEALDTALRRRFSFEEMMPKPNLIKDDCKAPDGMVGEIDLSELLKVINQRIEKLLDRDHMIGHSYFLKVGSPDELKESFKNEIIPLLQEYFYGDYGKIGLVLGTDFFEDVEKDNNIFAEFKDYDDLNGLNDKKIFRIKDIGRMGESEFESALNTLLNKPDNNKEDTDE